MKSQLSSHPFNSQGSFGSIPLLEQNDAALVKAMSAYEEASTQAAKIDALKEGVVVKLALNQTGSKFLQKVLENANP